MPSSESNDVEREIRVAARPETVFAFFVDPVKMPRWFGRQASVDPRPGGLYRVDINGHDIARGEFVEVVPNSRVVFTFGWEGEGNPVPPGSSTVEITLMPDGDGTLVRLRHSDLPSSESRDAHSHGWDHYLSRLEIAGAGGDAGADPWETRET